jgi:hypothetical protein
MRKNKMLAKIMAKRKSHGFCEITKEKLLCFNTAVITHVPKMTQRAEP